MTTRAIEQTDERRAFVESIRDFCRRECGTREQRDRLTDGGERRPQPGALREDGRARLARRRACPRSTAAPAAAAVDMCLLLDELAYGLAPVGGDRHTFIVAGAYERFGTEEQKQEILGGIVARRGRGDRDVGAGGRLRRRRAAPAGPSARDGRYVINGQKTWISNAHVAEHILLVGRTEPGAAPSTRASRCSTCPRARTAWRSAPIETMGGREVNDVFFTDCVRPGGGAARRARATAGRS